MAIIADIILPFALKSNFSYLPSPEQIPQLEPGKRVLVNFGKNKIYTGVIKRFYEEPDPGVFNSLKHIEEVLDETPVLTPLQLGLFEWIAFYYMCTEGEVLKAALPAGLKPESALRIKMAEGLDWENLKLNAKEYILMEVLSVQPELNFREAASIWDIANPGPRLKIMESRGWIVTYQKVEERYQAKYKSFIKISEEYTQEDMMKAALDSLSNSPQQENIFMRVLSDFYQKHPTPKTETLKEIKAPSTSLKALIEKGFLIEEKVQVDRLQFYGYKEIPQTITPNKEQLRVLDEIRASTASHPTKPILLHGITGSGKTQVYIELIREVIETGKQVLYLLPEIALTKQIIDRVKSTFGEKVGIYHSRFNDQERVEIWKKVAAGGYQIMIGVRSAVFLPFSDLGLIVVDESHDHSFKQQNPAPRYHARDLAVYYGQVAKCPVVMGTATPSFESYLNALKGKFTLVELKERATEATLPDIELTDMRIERKLKTIQGIFSKRLLEAITETLEKKEQIILFQNRRGYAPYLICQNCGHVPQCINCDISLTYHKHKDHLKCHYCSHTDYRMEKCPECAHYTLRKAGIGTEKIEEEVSKHFPQAVVQRLDMDTTRTKMAFQNIINRFETGQIDILVGTQMVSKGLDFENVTLVGVINADNILTFPDFRAFENGFQLLTQVSGRAGRSSKKGKVVIQTHMPENLVLRMVEENAPFEKFFHQEIVHRQEPLYPPVNRLIKIEMRHKDRQFVEKQSLKLEGFLRPRFGTDLLGPDYPLIARVRNLYRMQFLLKVGKTASPTLIRTELLELIDKYFLNAEKKTLKVVIDVDPT